MKYGRVFSLAVCILLLTCMCALSENFFVHEGEIIYTDVCPDGYQAIKDTLILGEGEMRVIVNQAKYFASDDPHILSVDKYGVMHALTRGKTVVSVYLEDNVRKDFFVEVRKAPSSLKLSEKKGTLAIGDTHQLKTTLTKESATTITWFSSAPRIVDVDDAGKLTALSTGECTITARTHNGLTAECAVTVVLPPPAEIDLFADSVTLTIGERVAVLYTLDGGYQETVEWTTNNASVATVDENGVITASGIGKTVICMTASGGDVRFIDVWVEEGATHVEFPSSGITMYTGGRSLFEPSIEGGNGKYEYISMDPSLVSVDPDTGELLALRTGSVYVLAVTPNLVFGELLVTVVDGPEELRFTSDRTEIAISESVFTRHNLEGYDKQFIQYESSDPEVAVVDEYGVITGEDEGTAVIRIHSGGLTDEIEITVLPMAKSITAWPESEILGVGDSTHARHSFKKGTGAIEYASSDVSVAQIDSHTGAIYALSEGTCEITLSLSNGVSDSFSITVLPAPESVFIEKSHYTLAQGNRHVFRFGINDGAATSYTVTSSDPEIVQYEEGRLICSDQTGSAILTVKTHNNLSALAEIRVIDEFGEIDVVAEKLILNPDFDYYIFLSKEDKHALDAHIENIPDIVFSYTASHPNIASVDENGVITAHKSGTSLVTVSLITGHEAHILVSVE